jgi:hypothetical protein
MDFPNLDFSANLLGVGESERYLFGRYRGPLRYDKFLDIGYILLLKL